ncbi:urokinase plasminogen activator surface receptor-like [Hemitrygon akajei]|uniref:urokinase plasminogen activator surface receptor-like n=1 Tax=Hemitrygon akajei TaxID=2704970 RepID=UPI003BFA1426
MMRTLLALALFLGLIAQAHPLQCYDCDSSRENCSLGQRNVTCNDTLNLTCITLTIRTKLLLPTSGFIEVQQTLFGCGICTDVISFNSGRTSVFVHSACCNSDLCNSQVEPEKENMTLNGLECEGCLTFTETACNRSMAAVSCHGEQNRCIHATSIIGNTSQITMGCASESLCNERNINLLFGFRRSNVTCCQENRCNNGFQDNPNTTTPGTTTSSPTTQTHSTPRQSTAARTTLTVTDNNTASAINTQPLLITLLLVLWATVL